MELECIARSVCIGKYKYPTVSNEIGRHLGSMGIAKEQEWKQEW